MNVLNNINYSKRVFDDKYIGGIISLMPIALGLALRQLD